MSAPLAAAAVFTATGLTAARDMSRGELPRARVIIGGTVAAVMLSAAAGAVPELVRALSIVIIIVALLGPGYDLVRPLTSLVGTNE